MQHFVMNNFSYTSKERQDRIFSDIKSIIILISECRRYQHNINHNNNFNNPQLVTLKASQLGNSRMRQQSRRTLLIQQAPLQQQRQQYASYGRKFQKLSYDQMLYLLCRKQVLHEFVCEFIKEKYQIKNLKYLGERIVNGIREVGDNNLPEISLQQCVNSRWIEIFSKEDIFYDVLEILKSNISKNWKVNQIKVQKKQLQQQSIHLNNQSSKIFQTQPNLDTIQVNPSKPFITTMKQGIQQSTRQILNGLQKLKRQMESCQAEMNMAKNNENKILEKNRQYSSKKKQYNQLKEVYRKRTEKREQGRDKQQLRKENDKRLQINNQSLIKKENSSKVLESNNNLPKQIIVNDQPHSDELNKLNYTQQKRSSTQKSTPPPLQQNSKPRTILEQVKQQQDDQLLLSKTIQDGFNKQLDGEKYDELISILDLVDKNQQKYERIGSLVSVQQPEQWKKILTNTKGQQPNSLLTSSKQQFLDKYVRRVFNHYILQQSSSKTHSLFDKSLSGSQLNFQSFAAERKSIPSKSNKDNGQNNQQGCKRLSIQIGQSVIREQGSRRRMSLAQAPISQSSYLKNRSINRERLRTVEYNMNNLSQIQSGQLASSQQMSIQSYSKFARAFNLVTLNVTLAQILHIFKRKSYNGRWITYNQFLEMFQMVYRLECDKIGIEFTAVMFDNYLKKEVFTWERVNKVLRLKTIQKNPGYKHIDNVGLKDNVQRGENKNGQRFNLVGHSGRLSEQIMQKISTSKKPFDRMPCLNRNYKTLSFTQDDNLPKSRIQIKVEQIKKLRQIQKARMKQQLQAYLKKSRTRESQLLNIKQDFNNFNSKSYLKRYKIMQHKKKKELDQKASNLPHDTRIINPKKFIESTQPLPPKPYSKPSLNSRLSMALRYNTIENNDQIQTQVDPNNQRRVRTLQPQTIQNQKVKSKRDIIELERIIGIRESNDEETDYEEDFERVQGMGRNAQQITGQVNRINNSMGVDVKSRVIQQLSAESSNHERSSFKRKKKRSQEDEYLADYFSKQSSHVSPIRYLDVKTQTISSKYQTDAFMPNNNGRHNWRVHY